MNTARFFTPKPFGPGKCPIYLKVLWMGEPFTKLSSGVKAAVDNCFASVNPRVIFTSKSILPIAHKDVVPATKKSNVIYEFQCHCDNQCIGCISQRLKDQIRKHVPKWIQSRITATRTFQLPLLKARYIKIRQPSLCKQKEFIFSLQLLK